ncbi:hypothetical protein [Candidatus Tokpelaia sp.]|uniref:hypothetical protein n=1 Tax=Candidatus Tokpelaia sp. TaxID=2233777 RepID=UPI00123B0A4B|nr:hypothetical protein [Candidatus Tokpelaia sp.]KAA6405779.1 hypothetical protein DPQ22_02850 [Candidatus Tokpelaia sp.]
MAGIATHQIAVLGAVGKGHLSLDALAEHLPIGRKYIAKAASKLILRGFLSREDKGGFSLTAPGSAFLDKGEMLKSGPKGTIGRPKIYADTQRQRIWRAIRLIRRFTVSDLAILACTGEEATPYDNIQAYIRKLAGSGYLTELPQRQAGQAETSNGFKIYRLIKDTGPRAPVWSKGRLVDLNEGAGSNG